MAFASVSRRRRTILMIALILVVAFGVWWWQWQAPYRTLNAFLTALLKGDVQTIYQLTPEIERRYGLVSPELIQRTYHLVFLPLLNDCQPLGWRIQRTSIHRPFLPELWLRRVRVVRFYVWFHCQQEKGVPRWLREEWNKEGVPHWLREGKKLPLVVFVSRPPKEERWCVAFGGFASALCIIKYGPEKEDEMMLKLGFSRYLTEKGNIVVLK